jgi:hypothetical protein
MNNSVSIQKACGFMRKNFGRFYKGKYTVSRNYEGLIEIYAHADSHAYEENFLKLLKKTSVYFIIRIETDGITVPRVILEGMKKNE